MKAVSLVLVLIMVSACAAVEIGVSEVGSAPPPDETTTSADSVATSSTTRPAPQPIPEYEAVPCTDTPTVAFSVLCESVESVLTYHVDAPDVAGLVAAARIGLNGVESVPGDPGFDRFTCYLPDEAFAPLCDDIAEHGRSINAPVSEFVTAAVESMFAYGLDPFSVYVPGDVLDGSFDDSGFVYSLGMVVSARREDGAACSPIGDACRLEVISSFEFSAARTGGVAAGDVITAIDDAMVDGLSAASAVARLEGRAGTAVDLDIQRRGQPLTRTLVRQDFRFVPTEWDFFDGGIAYFRMNDFSQQAAIDLGAFLGSDEVGASNALILDLRDNPGGLVLAAQAVASQFLDGGTVLVERGRDYSEELPVVDGGLATDRLQLVVLVNRGSASASEIVAAVLQERGRATVIGEPTFGKNLVQWVSETRDGGEMRVTIARWETPDGLDIGVRGLAPDVEVEVNPETDEDEVLETALGMLR